jgi:hypothetical protein
VRRKPVGNSFNYLVGKREHRIRNRNSERLGGVEVDDQFEFLMGELPTYRVAVRTRKEPALDLQRAAAWQGLTARKLAWAVGIPRHLKVYPADVQMI